MEAPTVRTAFLCAAAVLIVWAIATDRQHATRRPGVAAPSEPSQYGATSGSWKAGEWEFKPLATIRVHARVLSRERYWFDRGAKLSPVDLALGWGEMSDQRILDQLLISQGGRWYSWRPKKGTLPLSAGLIQAKSANMHMIPGNDEIRKLLLDVRAGDVIRFDGTLVEVSWPDGARWISSLKRTDTGGGSCELVWVENLTFDR